MADVRASAPEVEERAKRASRNPAETVAVVIVTYNRAEVLRCCLAGLAALDRQPDAVYVVDNASTDHTLEVLDSVTDLPLEVIASPVNDGGAGGFHRGVRAAYDAGHDRIWLMDDDVVPAPGCLTVLMNHPGPALMAVREGPDGRLCEKAATQFDLRNPLAIHPKRQTVDERYDERGSMPAEVPVENVAFEGFMVHRRVIDAIGLPDAGFFIFYDDVDFAVRTRRAGFPIVALRDAVLVRQLDFDQQHDMQSWKGYFMYRNLFVVHMRYGENALVRLKPYLIALAVLLLAPLRGGRAEAANVVKAIRAAPGLAKNRPAHPPAGAGTTTTHG